MEEDKISPGMMGMTGMDEATEPVSSDEVYADEMQQQRVANILGQTSPDNQLAEIEWRIKGYRKNQVTGKWEKIAEGVEEVSSLLVSRYVSFLSSILNNNTRFANLKEGEINEIMKTVIEWLVDDLDSNAEEYNLKGKYTERTRIGYILLNQTYIVLKRTLNGMESRRIWRSLNIGEDLKQRGNNGISSLLPWRK